VRRFVLNSIFQNNNCGGTTVIDKAKLQTFLASAKYEEICAAALHSPLPRSAYSAFLVLPPLVKSIVVGQLSEILHRPVSVEGLTINPYTLVAAG
jgi:hypothetical protein